MSRDKKIKFSLICLIVYFLINTSVLAGLTRVVSPISTHTLFKEGQQ